MPYDRKTELLWNYIGIAQFSDMARVWGQGPATFSNESDANPLVSDGLSARSDIGSNNNVPIRWSLPQDMPPPSVGSGAGISNPPHDSSSEPQLPGGGFVAHIAAEHYSAPSLSSGISGIIYGPLHFHNVMVQTEHSGLSGNPTTIGNDEIPKIYGPADVHMTGTIDSGGNIQANSVIVSGWSEAQGWSNVGTAVVSDLIDQINAPDTQSGLHLIVDYIRGDYTSTSVVTQLNTIYDNDVNHNVSSVAAALNSLLGNTSVAQGTTSGGNHSYNDAVLVGNQALSGYDVLVVTGDLTKINKIMQVNLIVDNDVNTTVAHGDISTPHGSASSIWDAAIQSGGNMEVNIGFIVDQSTGITYLVGGYYGSSHSVTQLNILSDSDLNQILQLFHSQEGMGFLSLDASGLISSGGNNQSNTAGFIGSGEEGPSDTSHAVPSDLTSLLAFAGLHPGDGDIHVLYVDGNYTIINLVVQINVIQDSDHNTQISNASGAMGSLTAPVAHDDAAATSSDNTAPPANADGTTTGQDGSSSSQQTASSESGGTTGTADTTSHDNSGSGTTDTAPASETAGTDNSAGTATDSSSTDNSMPVYTDHGSLNYDQITSSGSNQAGNQATLIDGSDGHQLQIILGNYNEYNEVYQVNILYDSDHNQIVDSMNVNVNMGSSDNTSQDTTHLTSANDVLHKMMT